MGGHPKPPFSISYPHTKFGANRLKQTQVIGRKTKADFWQLGIATLMSVIKVKVFRGNPG